MKTLVAAIKQLKGDAEVIDFLRSLFTDEEIDEFEKRIAIVTMLIKGNSYREVAEKLGVGVATVGRGVRELKKNRFKFLRKTNEKQ